MRSQHGLTLLEMLITLGIAASLASLAIPTFAALRSRAARATAYHQLTATLSQARMLAVASGAPVTVCPSSDGQRCRGDLVWDDGWIVFRDPGKNRQPADAQAVLLSLLRPAPGIRIRSTPGRLQVRYQPSGFSPGTNVRLSVCDAASGRLHGAVVVSNSGRSRVEDDATRVQACPP